MNHPQAAAPRDIKPVDGVFDYNRVPRGHYEKIIWNDNPIRSFWHQMRFLETEAMMDTTQNSVIMDYGCASGSFLGSLRKPFAKAFGVDIARPQIDLANEKYGTSKLSFVAADYRSLDFAKETFDFIVASEIIEHVTYKDALEMLGVFRSLLNPGGKLLISTPNYQSLWPVLEVLVNQFSEVDYDHQHINKLDLKKSRRMLEEASFEVKEVLTQLVLSPFLAGISRKLAEKAYAMERKVLSRAGSIILISAVKR